MDTRAHIWAQESVSAEALDRCVLGASRRGRWPVRQDDRGRGSVLVGGVRGDPARRSTDARQGALFSVR